MRKEVWHTDIVIDGHGFGLMLHEEPTGPALRYELWFVEAEPDRPGPRSDQLWSFFQQHFMLREGMYAGWRELSEAKRDIEMAIDAMGGMWNGWHKHTYKG